MTLNQESKKELAVPAERAIEPSEPWKARVALNLEEMAYYFNSHRALLREKLMQAGTDYGVIPGTTAKSLWRAGAEKLLILHGYAHRLVIEDPGLDRIELWDRDAPMFFYRYRCDIIDRRTDAVIATAYGSASSREDKYAYRWVSESQAKSLGLDPTRLSAKWARKGGKSWRLYRIDNPDIPSLVNTIDKMAQKRALIGATRAATAASGLFTEEDIPLADERGGEEAAVPMGESGAENGGNEEEAKEEEQSVESSKLEEHIGAQLFNEVNDALQDLDPPLPAFYTGKTHILNTVKLLGLNVQGEREGLVTALIQHAREGLAKPKARAKR